MTAQSDDLIPLDAISLPDAFDLIVQEAFEDANFYQRIEGADLIGFLEGCRQAEIEDYGLEHSDEIIRQLAADILFRSQLAIGNITACVLHPASGIILQLPTSGWMPPLECLHGMMFSHIDPDNAFFGPTGSVILGKARPVFLMKNEFKHWFDAAFPDATKIGRPPGSGSFRSADEPLVAEMARMMEADVNLSVPSAALKVANRAIGLATIESKAKRLERRHRDYLRSRRSL